MKHDNIIVPYKPLPWQAEAWRDKSRIVLLTGSAGGGKSHCAGEKLHAYCHKYPGAMALMLRKTRNSMTNSTVLFMERTVIGSDPQVKHYPSKHRFEYANGSILAYGGMADEEQREQIRSIGQAGGVDIAWMEEAIRFREDDYNELLARMRGTAGGWRQILLSTNPGPPRHWIYTRLIKGGEASIHKSRAVDNPYNASDYHLALASLTGVLAKRMRDGIWAQAEGAVYDEFDALNTHGLVRARDEFERFIVGVDEGYTNPSVALVIGVDSDERTHIIEEFYETQVLQERFVKVCQDIYERYQREARNATGEVILDENGECRRIPLIRGYYVDSSAAGLIAALKAAGLRAYPSSHKVHDGIQEVKARLLVRGDGRPRHTIDPDCVNVIGEFESYVWATDRAGNVLDKPVKENDHAMDALRYAAMSLVQKQKVIVAGVGFRGR